MQVAGPVGQPLDGDHRRANGRGERETGEHAPPVHQHGAGTALPVVAALLRSGEAEMFPQRVKERRSGIEIELVPTAIHRKIGDDEPIGLGGHLCWCGAARVKCGEHWRRGRDRDARAEKRAPADAGLRSVSLNGHAEPPEELQGWRFRSELTGARAGSLRISGTRRCRICPAR